MVVVYITDKGFEAQCGISLLSLLQNNLEMTFDIYIMDSGISEDGRYRLAQISSDIHYIDIRGLRDDERFRESNGYNPIVFVRLLLAELLPVTVDRVLYIDSDSVIHGSIKELETLDISDVDVAAVPELYMPTAIKQRTVGFRKQDIYYNAGILLINLKSWRERRLGDVFLRYLREHRESLLYNDQDIINACCKGRIKTLPPTYDMNPNLPYFPYWFVRRHFIWYQGVMECLHKNAQVDISDRKRYEAMLQYPVIIHYMGDERPWIAGSHNYYGDVWRLYQEMSPWNPYEMETGKKFYLFIYHMLNVVTSIAPWFRILFSRLIGIYVPSWRKK